MSWAGLGSAQGGDTEQGRPSLSGVLSPGRTRAPLEASHSPPKPGPPHARWAKPSCSRAQAASPAHSASTRPGPTPAGRGQNSGP